MSSDASDRESEQNGQFGAEKETTPVVEMVRFRVIAGQEAAAREWVAYLRDHPTQFRETMIPERMQVETILSDEQEGRLHLTWFSVQLPGGAPVQDSEHELDRIHLDYWRRCIDPDWGPQRLTPEIFMSSEPVQRAFEQ